MSNKEPAGNNNLNIWEQVKETDIRYTKESDFGGRRQTSINGTYMVMKATEVFGPIGKGWGYEIIEERTDNGRAVFNGGEIQGHEVVHTIRLKLWYMQDGERSSVEHFGHTPFITWSNNYKKFNTDMDAPKKSLTDAIKKCLSMLGFSADIFLGQFEDAEYIQEITEKSIARHEDSKDEQIAARRKEVSDWFKEQLELLKEIQKVGALKLRYEEIAKRCERDCKLAQLDPTPWRRSLNKAYNERKEEITPDVDLVCKECGVEQKAKPGKPCEECGGETAPKQPGQ